MLGCEDGCLDGKWRIKECLWEVSQEREVVMTEEGLGRVGGGSEKVANGVEAHCTQG